MESEKFINAIKLKQSKNNNKKVNGMVKKCPQLLSDELKDGNYAAHYAATFGKITLLSKCFRAAPQTFLEKNNKNETPMQIAASKGHWKLVEFIISKASSFKNLRKAGFGHALLLAAKKDKVEIVEKLLDVKAPLKNSSGHSYKDDDGNNCLHYAVKYNNRTMVRKLLHYPLNSEGVLNADNNKDGLNPLMYALDLKHRDCVAVFVDKKITSRSDELYKALKDAVDSKKHNREFLIDQAFDYIMRGRIDEIDGVAQEVIKFSERDITTNIIEKTLLQLLDDHPEYLNEYIHDGKTMLHIATERNKTSFVDKLVQFGGLELNRPTMSKEGMFTEKTPVYFAGMNGNQAIYDLIIESTPEGDEKTRMRKFYCAIVVKRGKFDTAIQKIKNCVKAIDEHTRKFNEDSEEGKASRILVKKLDKLTKEYEKGEFYDQDTALQYIKNSKKAIKKSYKILSQHRGWKGVIGNLLLALTGLGLIAIAAKAAYSYKKDGYVRLFFKTASAEKVDNLDDNLDELSQTAASPAA